MLNWISILDNWCQDGAACCVLPAVIIRQIVLLCDGRFQRARHVAMLSSRSVKSSNYSPSASFHWRSLPSVLVAFYRRWTSLDPINSFGSPFPFATSHSTTIITCTESTSYLALKNTFYGFLDSPRFSFGKQNKKCSQRTLKADPRRRRSERAWKLKFDVLMLLEIRTPTSRRKVQFRSWYSVGRKWEWLSILS